MTILETAAWKLAGVAAGISAALGRFIWWLIRRWVDAKFKAVEDRVKQNEEDINELQDQSAEHEAQMREVRTHIKYNHEHWEAHGNSIDRLHDKVDTLIGARNDKT